jgi:hypothetical protein
MSAALGVEALDVLEGESALLGENISELFCDDTTFSSFGVAIESLTADREFFARASLDKESRGEDKESLGEEKESLKADKSLLPGILSLTFSCDRTSAVGSEDLGVVVTL